MVKLFIVFILIIYSNIIYSQNLITNTSFENNSGCPSYYDQINLSDNWFSPTIGISDYFNVCNVTSFVGIPQNQIGFENAYKGDAYIGISTFYCNISEIRDYIQTELMDTLESGKKYYVEFYVSLADSIQYANNTLGALFSDIPVNDSNNFILLNSPQVSNFNNPLTNKNGWTKVSGVFTANGGEKYMTIGNFLPDSLSDTVFVGGGIPSWEIAYYYIDAVTVMLDTSVNQRDVTVTQTEIMVSPNPANNFVTFNCILPKTERAELYLYNLQGKKLFSKNLPLQAEHFEISLSEFPPGVYFYEIKTGLQVIKRDKLVIVR